jgi:hypothetical protein
MKCLHSGKWSSVQDRLNLIYSDKYVGLRLVGVEEPAASALLLQRVGDDGGAEQHQHVEHDRPVPLHPAQHQLYHEACLLC